MARLPSIDVILDGFLRTLSGQLETALPSVRQAVFSYGRSFVRESCDDVMRWTEQVANGRLKPDELEFLVRSKVDLLELKALEQAGLTKVRLDEIRSSMTRSVLGGILGATGL